MNRISELEQELQIERTKRQNLEILLRERGDHVESLKMALRMIEPSAKPKTTQNDLGQRPRSDGSNDLSRTLSLDLPNVPFWKRWKR